MQPKTVSFRHALLRWMSGLLLVVVSAAAWSTFVTPSTSYDGSYTVNWQQTLGCTTQYQYPYYWDDCYYGMENANGAGWQVVASSGNTMAVSGKTAGSYQYQLYYVMYMFGQVWQEGPASTAVTATVSGPATPNTPSGPTGTEYDGAYTISWNSVQYATTYRLEERLNGGSWSMIQNTSSLSKAVSGKTPGTWDYRVRSENSVGTSSYSGIKSVAVAAPATPGTPSGPTGTEYDGAYTISWSAVTGATNYTLQERLNAGSWSTIQSSSSTSRAISGKTPGTWDYRVRAESAAGNSSYSGTKSVTVAAPAAPGTPSGPSTDYDGSYTISWSSVTGAATYRLEERFNGGSWSMIQNTSSLSKALSGKTAGTWDYRVRAEAGAGNSGYSGTRSVVVSAPATPGTPSGPTGTEYDGAYTISWSAVTGATNYTLQERFNGGSWSTIQSSSATSKAISGKTPGTWEYQVRAENTIGNSNFSSPKSVTVAAPATPGTPSGPTGTEYDGAYTISWSSVTGAATYRLEERLNGGSWSMIQNTSSLSKAISGKTPGTWDYRVRAESAAGNSSFSGIKSVSVAAPATPGAPSGPTGTEYDGAYTISWSAVTGATNYTLQERLNGGSWSTIQSSSSTSKAVSGKTPGTWDYQVRAESAAGNSSYSAPKSVAVSAPATPPTPTGPTSNYGGSYTISWSSQTGATQYTLQERPAGGSWVTIQDTGDTSKLVSVSTEGTREYQVRACSAAGCSSYSALAAVSVSMPPTTTGATPGAIPARFSVGTQGEASYSIPINVPAGTGGLKPGLALSYNHLAGNGLAGMRWTLSGISSITRCEPTVAQDGAAGPIRYTSADRYCLNGQRLVNLTSSGSYHADETEYRTEIESFQRIVQDGTLAGGGAESFRVDHGNGLSSYFGETAGSRIAGPGTTARAWYISRTVDQFGNTIEYSYNEVSASELIPETITWTGNDTTTPTLEPRYAITITYETRPSDDQRSGYDGGGGYWLRTKRIDEIEVSYDDGSTVSEIATYDLSYESSSATGRSQLSEVSVCRASDCLPATTFAVQDATPGWYNLLSTGAPIGGNPLLGDWNGDGRLDLFQTVSNEWRVYPGKADGYFDTSFIDTNISSTTNPDKARVFDFDGDGLADLMYQDGSSNWKVAPSDGDDTGSGFGSAVDTGIATSLVQTPYLMDFNGDGLADLLYSVGTGLVWKANEGGSFSSSTSGSYTAEVSIPSYSVGTVDSGIRSLDANGDGRADLIVEVEVMVCNPQDPEDCYFEYDYHLLLANGSSFDTITFSEGIQEGYHNTNFRIGDFNGDGLSDFLYLNHLGTAWILKISAGDDVVSGSAGSVPVTNADKVMIADYDGDGRDDLIRADGDYLYVHRSDGATLPGTATTSLSSSGIGSAVAFAADIPGSAYANILRTNGSYWYTHQHKSDLADVVTDFTDGLDRTISVNYESLARTSAYTLDLDLNPASAEQPYVHRYSGTRYVVTTETHDDGIGGTRDFLHTYDTAFVNRAGRGWQSFHEHKVEDDAQDTYVLTEYDQTFPTAGIPVLVESRTVTGDKLIHSVTSTLPDGSQSEPIELSGSTPPRQFPRVEETTTVEKEVFGANDGDTLRTVVEDPEYDTDYGYVKTVVRTVTQPGVSGSWISSTDYDRENNDIVTASTYCIGLPGTVETSNSIPGGSPVVRKVELAFNTDCSLDTITDLSDTDTTKQLETSYGYDQYGNVTSVTKDSVAGTSAARTTTIGYDDDGQLPDSVIVDSPGLNLGTTLEWDYLTGLRTSVTGADGLESSFEFDAFGRLMKETRPSTSGADHTDYTYRVCSTCFPDEAAFYVLVEDASGGERYTFYDHLERPVGSETALRGGARSREEVRYLAMGHVDKSSVPYIAGDDVYWVNYDYDSVGRLIEEDAPVSEAQGSGAATEYAYLGLTLAVTDAENRTTEYVHNAMGQIEQVVDAMDGETAYAYYPFGELHTVTDNAANVTTITYDARGFKDEMTDPDMGTWYYDHNVFGELAWQEDAKGQETDISYDKAGRPDSRDAEGEVTNWHYYTSGLGQKGRLESIEIYGENLEEAYTYSSVTGLLTQVTRAIGSGNTYTFDYDYDSVGRLSEMTYPTNVHSTRFGVEYAYDGWGALSEVIDADTPSLVYYAQDSQDAFGRATQATLGNGLVEKLGYSRATGHLVSIETGPGQTSSLQNLSLDWDMVGNLAERVDANLSNRTDVFSYDALDRLKDVVRDSSNIFSVTYDTNHLGNIKTKTGVSGTYTYGGGSAGPHAVSSIGSMTFGYDANGNMTNRDGEMIGWTVDNLPDAIDNGTDYTDFVYGPDRGRWMQDGKEGSWTYTRHYVGAFETLKWDTTDRVDTHYIFANGEAVAQWTTSNVQSDELQYLHRDHQGNVVATTDDGGDLLAEFEYDPFGARTTTYGTDDDVTRGYTGHEHLDPVDLIHMNGRVQDPLIGRFLSPDPFVQAPYYSQSLNRYSYVWNNPMSLVDPSGFQSDDPYDTNDEDNWWRYCIFWLVCRDPATGEWGVGQPGGRDRSREQGAAGLGAASAFHGTLSGGFGFGFSSGFPTGGGSYGGGSSTGGGAASAPSATAGRIVIGIEGAGRSSLPENVAFRNLARQAGATDDTIYPSGFMVGANLRKINRRIDDFRSTNPDGSVYLLGYSAGGHAAIRLAERLAEDGVEVNGLTTIDPHSARRLFGFEDYELPGNVQNALNFYQQGERALFGGNPFLGGRVSCPSCSNSDPNRDRTGNSTHLNIVRGLGASDRQEILQILGTP